MSVSLPPFLTPNLTLILLLIPRYDRTYSGCYAYGITLEKVDLKLE